VGRALAHDKDEHYLKPLVRHLNVRLAIIANKMGCTEQYLSMALNNRVVLGRDLETKLEETVLAICQGIFKSRDARDEKRKELLAEYFDEIKEV